MQRDAKRLLGQSILELALILAVLRQTDVDFSYGTEHQDEVHGDTFYNDGPLFGLVSSPVHHFQQSLGGVGSFLKSADSRYDSVLDEYENIMRNVRSRPPVSFTPQNVEMNGADIARRENGHRNGDTGRSVITMVLSVPNEAPVFQNNGSVLVTRHFQSEGAVGGYGIGLPYSADENLDIFEDYIPENMLEDDIDSLMISGGENSSTTNQSSPDLNWQQFLVGHDNSLNSFWGSFKANNGNFGDHRNFDVLSEAVQSAEIFLPFAANGQNASDAVNVAEMGTDQGFETDGDLVMASRLEMIETSEWASQNHEEDLLFPSLPPPSYEEVTASNNSAPEGVRIHEPLTDHMHDHNYYNASAPAAPSSGERSTGYAIRSRHEVSTRVITIPPRPRHTSDASSEASDTIDLTSEGFTRSSVRRITSSSDSSMEEIQEDPSSSYRLSSCEIKPVDSSYFENLRKDVGLHREVILCN